MCYVLCVIASESQKPPSFSAALCSCSCFFSGCLLAHSFQGALCHAPNINSQERGKIGVVILVKRRAHTQNPKTPKTETETQNRREGDPNHEAARPKTPHLESTILLQVMEKPFRFSRIAEFS